MTKLNGKRIRREGHGTRKFFRKLTNNISTEAVNHPPVPHINSAEYLAMAHVVDSNESSTLTKEELSGYIFMCNGKTKPECYINRVFGLPAGRKEVVEKIKPGTKLFLYDFNVKFLYGVYEAVSNGGMNLQPTAFGGRFPAQVKFKICMDSLPLPISSFRTAIKDNFQGSKFTQELNDQQVRDLLLLFKPIVAPSPATLHPLVPEPWVQSPASSGAPGPQMPPAAINGRLNPSLNPSLLKPYQPRMARPWHNSSQQTNALQLVQEFGLDPYPHHHHPSAVVSAYVNPYQFAENQPSSFSTELPKDPQEPYSRYMTTPEVYPHDQTTGYNGLGLQTVMNPIDRSHGHNPYPTPAPLYASTAPPYSGLTYVHPQSSAPVSSYYSFVGGTQITR